MKKLISLIRAGVSVPFVGLLSFALISPFLADAVARAEAGTVLNHSANPMPAHEFKSEGPWFEGWYTRVVDLNHGVSIAMITTSAIHDGQNLDRSARPPGYAAIVIQNGEFSKSFEAFPGVTEIGNTIVQTTGLDFSWNADGVGSATSARTELMINDSHAVIDVKSRAPWSPLDSDAGPEGLLQFVPLPLHWYVHNTHGQASYSVDYIQDGVKKHLSGVGVVHQEKNWGQIFPESWVWMQATNDNAYLTLAGGDLGVGPITAHTYLVGYRSTKVSADFNLGQGLLTSFHDSVDWCQRSFKMISYSGVYKLEIKATAAPSSFVALSIPTNTGYQQRGAFESFTAHVSSRIYRVNGFVLTPDYTLIEAQEFNQAALEFGANALLCARGD